MEATKRPGPAWRIAGTLVIVLFVAGMVFWYRGNQVFSLDVPAQPAPSGPNAFDSFAAASRLSRDSDLIHQASTPNSALAPDLSNALQGVDDDQAARIIADNRAAVAAVRSGIGKPYVAPPIFSFDQRLPYLATDRDLGRLLSFEAKVAAKQGNWRAEVSDSLDALTLGNDVARTGGVLQKLVALSIAATARPPAWAAVNHLDAADAEEAARRLEAITARRRSFSDTLAAEKTITEGCLLHALRTSQSPMAIGADSDKWYYKLLSNAYFTVHPKQRSLVEYDSYSSRQAASARLSYQSAKKLESLPPPKDLICTVAAQNMDMNLFKDTRDLAFDRLLMTSLALRAYSLDHGGSYPSTLASLVPRYLAVVPQDPFADRTPLIYRTNPGGFLLYSIGPDGTDDGGAPLRHRQSNGEMTLRLSMPNDRGDLVAGVNCG